MGLIQVIQVDRYGIANMDHLQLHDLSTFDPSDPSDPSK